VKIVDRLLGTHTWPLEPIPVYAEKPAR
jgi:hypothetical protein